MTNTELTFKKNLIKMRESKGISRYRLAILLKIDKGYYYRMEDFSKSQSPTYDMLEKIADFYDVPVYRLFM